MGLGATPEAICTLNAGHGRFLACSMQVEEANNPVLGRTAMQQLHQIRDAHEYLFFDAAVYMRVRHPSS
jgi:hypothetical protein